MANRRRKSAIVTKKRLSAPVDGAVVQKAAAYAKVRGVTLGSVVQAALEAYLRGFYWIDPRAIEPDAQSVTEET
jgi:hypothetical protein